MSYASRKGITSYESLKFNYTYHFMPENENTEVPEVEEVDEDLNEDLDTELDEKDTDWKAEAEKARGIAKRLKTKLAKAGTVKKESPVQAANKEDKKGFDYAEKAYLKTSGIQSEEFEFVKKVMDSTGKSLDEVLEARYFQAELKERRDAKASKDAIPNGTKRSGTSASNEVDFWLNKGELPPADQKELRQKVVNARIKLEGTKDVFSSRSVVGG